MLKHFYNKYSDDQKVSFWVVVSNIVLVIFTFGFGILIQDSMLRSNQKVNAAIARYDYGSRVFPMVKSIYSEYGSEILCEFNKWKEVSDNVAQTDSLYNIYLNNKEIYSHFCDTLVHTMGSLKYYFPEYEREISINNTQILMCNGLLKYFDSLKNRSQDADSISNVLLYNINKSPDLWIYGNGHDSQLNDSIEKLISLNKEQINGEISLEDSTLSLIPELYEPLVDLNNQNIVNQEIELIKNLNRSILSNIIIFNKISRPESNDSWSHIKEFFTWHWLVFILVILLSIVGAIFFAVVIFPRRINRNHTSEEYRKLEKTISQQKEMLHLYEHLLSIKKDMETKNE